VETYKKHYISFVLIGKSKTGKTEIYKVISNMHGTGLGIIKWYPQWRQYCFFTEFRTIWSVGCLLDITAFLQKLNTKRMNEQMEMLK
jgi:hypothetical protein